VFFCGFGCRYRTTASQSCALDSIYARGVPCGKMGRFVVSHPSLVQQVRTYENGGAHYLRIYL
jgi:hypothetical protein